MNRKKITPACIALMLVISTGTSLLSISAGTAYEIEQTTPGENLPTIVVADVPEELPETDPSEENNNAPQEIPLCPEPSEDANDIGNEGCNALFWRTHTYLWVSYSPDMRINREFIILWNEATFHFDVDYTLLDILYFGDESELLGAAKTLIREAFAALLNDAHPDIEYPLTKQQIFSQAICALKTMDITNILSQAHEFESNNNLGSEFCEECESCDTEPPSKVENLIVSDAKEGKLDLSWDAATDNIGVDHYNIYRDNTFIIHISSLVYQDTGLTNGQEYTYMVSAVDAQGNEGEPSDPASGIPTGDNPGNESEYEGCSAEFWRTHTESWVDYSPDTRIVGVFAVLLDNGTITIHVNITLLDVLFFENESGLLGSAKELLREAMAGLLNDAHPEINYPLSKNEILIQVVSALQSEHEETIRSLTVELFSYNHLGSELCEECPSCDTEPPSKVENLIVTDTKDGKLNLTWDPATDNVGVDHYRIYRDGVFLTITSSTQYQDTGLTNGQEYTYMVSAVDAQGNEGEPSDPASGIPTATPSPIPPIADANGPYAGYVNSALLFDGSESYDPDGSIISYLWDFGDGTTATGATLLHTYTSTGIFIVTLTVVDDSSLSGINITSASITVSTDEVPPSKVENLTVTDAKDGKLLLTWDAATDDIAVVYYKIYRDDMFLINVTTLTYLDTNLNNGQLYTYQVSAVDSSSNEGESSDPASGIPTATPLLDTQAPSKVENLTVTDAKDGKLNLTWDPATDNVGIDHYRIYRDGVFLINVTGVTYLDTGLTNGQLYWYNVSAVDGAGNKGEQSDGASGIPTATSGPGPSSDGGHSETPNKNPIADASAGEPYQGYIGEILTFDGSKSYDPDGRLVEYLWIFHDGTTEKGMKVQHAFENAGFHAVLLRVKDNKGATGTVTTFADIRNIPNLSPADPTINGPESGTINISYTFTLVSSDPENQTIRYLIEWGDNSSNTSDFLPSGTPLSLNHAWSSPGVYTIVVRADDGTSVSGETIFTITIEIQVIQQAEQSENLFWLILGALTSLLSVPLLTFVYRRKTYE